MVKWMYGIQTNIPRNFDPEIGGATIDSIVSSCKYVEKWAVPYTLENTLIIVEASQELGDEEKTYLREQLLGEFPDYEEFSMRQVKEGQRTSSGRLNVPN